jgi:hypothetical protein
MFAYVVGEFLNTYALARMKVATEGRGLALRAPAQPQDGAKLSLGHQGQAERLERCEARLDRNFGWTAGDD